MLLGAVIIIGVLLLAEIWSVGRQLQNLLEETEKIRAIGAALTDELEDIKQIPKDILAELQWHRDSTFAHKLMNWLDGVSKGVESELQWHHDSTFASELLNRLDELSKDIRDEMRGASADIISTLDKLEGNVPRD